MKRIDINVDIGEGQPWDADLLAFATSANICCGSHAGSPELTGSTIELCRQHGIRIGMHPGFPDPTNLGRRIPTKYEVDPYLDSLIGQADFFSSLTQPKYVKPHGAWYWMVHPLADDPMDPTVQRGLRAVLTTIMFKFKIPAMLMPEATEFLSLEPRWIIREGFADRGYSPRGQLLRRGAENGVLRDPKVISEQVLRLASSVDSLCIHGDTPGCVGIAELVKKTLQDAGYEVGA